VELVVRRPKCKSYGEKLKDFTYLDNVSEDMLWETYSHCLDTAGSEAFTDFSQENKETFNRLKLRSIDDRIKKLSS